MAAPVGLAAGELGSFPAPVNPVDPVELAALQPAIAIASDRTPHRALSDI